MDGLEYPSSSRIHLLTACCSWLLLGLQAGEARASSEDFKGAMHCSCINISSVLILNI